MSGFVIVCKKRRCPHSKQDSFPTYFFNYRARAVLNYSLEPSESLYMSRIQEVGPEGSFHEFRKENCNVKIRVERSKWKFLAGFLKNIIFTYAKGTFRSEAFMDKSPV